MNFHDLDGDHESRELASEISVGQKGSYGVTDRRLL